MNDFLRDLRVLFAGKRGVVAGTVAVVVIIVIAAGVSLLGNSARTSLSGSFNSVTQRDLDSGSMGYSKSELATDAYYPGSVGERVTPMPNVPPSSTSDLPKDRKVIQNGSLDVLVKDADSAAKQITSIAESNEGFAENISLYEVSDGVKSGTMSVRVPAVNFAKTMEAIKEIVVKVRREGVTSNDVTAPTS
ncbi:MAG TPA: DUF4349 domain-containing protein [Candidatus Paceibacterota bacterium]